MSNGTGKPKRAMQLVGALIAVAGLLATLTALATAQNTTSTFYSGNITGPDFCTNRSLGGPVTYPLDSDKDGVADTCSLTRTRRATAARQNAMERLGGELPLALSLLFAEECLKVAETYGEPKDEATDECAAPRAAQASGRTIPAVPSSPFPLDNTSRGFYSGPVVTSRTFCLSRSFGGPVTYPFDSDGDGVADTCSLARTRRAAVARQNTFERLAAAQPELLLQLFAQECRRVPATFGEPAAEAADECATGVIGPTGTPLPGSRPGAGSTPLPGSRPGSGSTPGTGGFTTPPTYPPVTPPSSPVATNPGTYNKRAARNLQLDPGNNQIAVSWTVVPSSVDADDTANQGKTDPYDSDDVYEYEVWWTPKGQSWSTTRRYIATGASTTRYTIPNLTNLVTYSVRVKAVRGPSGDPFTPTLTSTPGLAGPPEWPEENALTSPFYGQITARWDKPHGAGDDKIDSYVIQWSTSSGGFSSTRQAITGPATTSYTITGLSSATYYVRVQGVSASGPGTWSHNASLRLISTRPAPGQPTGLTLSTAANSRLTATWVKPSSTNEPTHYQVQWRNLTTRENWAPSRERTITGADTLTTTVPASGSLIASNQYEARVRAINQDIAGSWSSAARIVLGQAAAPSNIRLDPDGGHKITVNWSQVTSVPPVSGYNLQYDTNSGFASNCSVDASCIQVSKTSGSTSHDITGLDNNVTYYVRMQSINANGPGPWSSILSVKPGAPRAPTSVRAVSVVVVTNDDYRKLTVSWVSRNEANKPKLSGFTVRYRRTGTMSWSSSNLSDFADRTDKAYNCTSGDINGDVGDTNFSCTLTGLLSDVSYDVEMRTRNSFGDGPWSTRTTGTPANGKVSAPSISVKDVANQSGSLRVSWTPTDESPKPAATSFQVEWCHTPTGGSKTCRTSTRSLSPNQDGNIQYTITGLTNGTSYEVRVRARNTHGYSSWSSVVDRTPTNTN